MSWKPTFIGSGSNSGWKIWTLVAVATVIVVAAVVGLWAWSRDATVSGETSAERIESITRLAAEGGAGAGKAIAGAAVGDSDPQVRCVAFVSLRTYASPAVRDAVEKGTRDEVPKVRAAAAMTLGEYADGAAATRLGEVLLTDPDEGVRLAAARGLARCDSDQADDLLASAMKANTSAAVQERALKLLLEGTGVKLTPEPDPKDAALWARHVRNVMRHIEATRANEPLGRRGGKEER